jgi:hypothetical protein
MAKQKTLMQKKYKNFILYSWLFLVLGVLLFGLGIVKYAFGQPEVGVNLSKLQPTISNGSILLILGLGFFFIGLYRLLTSAKSFNTLLEIEKIEQIKKSKFKN